MSRDGGRLTGRMGSTLVSVEPGVGVAAVVVAPVLSGNGADGCLLGFPVVVLYAVWGCSSRLLCGGESIGNDLESFCLGLVD